MTSMNKEIGRPELLNAIRNSIEDARHTIKALADSFAVNVQPLRMEESEKVFSNLARNINDLKYLMEFVEQLKDGMHYFDAFGLPDDPISENHSGLNLFQEMHSAFESKDWIMLSDLIEYELSPLLHKEDEWFGSLGEKASAYTM